jgi:hypothetical protein
MSPEPADKHPAARIDLERPSVARVYDFMLGGTTNWAVDREFGEQVLARFPLFRDIAIANRLFLNRVVRHLMRRGVRQFLDIGAGVPTAGNTHQVADEFAVEAGFEPDARVVYVDNEPVAVAHAELLLDREGDARRQAMIDGDLREPDRVWRDALDTELLDPAKPIALLLLAVLHVAQPGPDGTDIGPESVARFRELLAPGSYLAISHATYEGLPPELDDKVAGLKTQYDSAASNNVVQRGHADIEAMLGDFRPIEPGWTWTPAWRPEETGPTARTVEFATPAHSIIWAGVGEKL